MMTSCIDPATVQVESKPERQETKSEGIFSLPYSSGTTWLSLGYRFPWGMRWCNSTWPWLKCINRGLEKECMRGGQRWERMFFTGDYRHPGLSNGIQWRLPWSWQILSRRGWYSKQRRKIELTRSAESDWVVVCLRLSHERQEGLRVDDGGELSQVKVHEDLDQVPYGTFCRLLGVAVTSMWSLPGESLGTSWWSRGRTMLATRFLTWGTEKSAWMN